MYKRYKVVIMKRLRTLLATVRQNRTNSAIAALFVVAIVGVGIYLLGARAAGFFASTEAESGIKTANAITVTDTSASGGSAVKFTAPTSGGGGTGGTCPGEPNQPDGEDPWGGCFPGASNTGVPDGTVLTTYTGPMTITTDNTVIDSKLITGDLEISAQNVLIKRSKIVNGSAQDRKVAGSSFTIEDTTIEVGNRQQRGIWGDHITVSRLDVSGGYSGGWCNFCNVSDSWFHHLYYESGWHVSAFRQDHYLTLRHNVLSCDLPIFPDGGCSADMTGYGDFHVVEHNMLERNLYISNPGASYCAYGGSTPGKPYSDGANNIVFSQNVFQRGASGHCGRYGLVARFDASLPGNLWTGNMWDDGSIIPVPAF